MCLDTIACFAFPVVVRKKVIATGDGGAMLLSPAERWMQAGEWDGAPEGDEASLYNFHRWRVIAFNVFRS